MQSQTTLRRHAALVDNMAQARGIDLEEQMLRGKLSMTDLENAVLHCTGCTAVDKCEHWLDAQDATTSDTPEYCRNAALFRALEQD
ncbi:DUF6455 family protein [Antarctobacter heliothermus]|uniref:DUF6455 domain-containing protein n=1 Tax=Antarctobacter heliothermus TaxID=74033 RepID=A0A239KLI3_9RHOB|nr:DUF6455 family protein [Antarctobacter heliothermus]SNT18925.1 hypothetical protein SAMN04488078_106721 [Antarctobacter heliothermus]